MRKILSYVLAVLLIAAMSVLFFSGCQKGGEAAAAEEEEETTTEEVAAAEEEEEEETTTAAEEEIKIGMDIKTLDNPYFVNVLGAAREECDNRGWELIDVQSANDTELQQQLVDDLVVQGVDAIIMFATTDPVSMKSVIQSSIDAEIPVIALDDSILGSEVSIFAADNVAGGEKQAQYVVDNIGEEGMACILEGIAGQTTAMDRTKGNMNIFDKYSGITTAVKNADWSMDLGLSVMDDFLQAYDEINAVTAGNDTMILGAVASIEAAGKLDEIVTVGFDGIDDAITAIKEGKLNATLSADSKELGAQSVIIAEKILNGESFDYTDVEYDWGTQKAIYIPTVLVTEENVDELFPD